MPAAAQDYPLLNTYALPGLIEMPSANSLSTDDLTYSYLIFRNTVRHAASFQISNRLTFGMRYNMSYFSDADGGAFGSEDNFDRSFGLQYRLINEGNFVPAVVVGINDVLGTGRFESEYLVATKNLFGRLSVSAGLGWGRLAGVSPMENPLAGLFPSLETREPPPESGNGTGELRDIQWFSGPVSVFGGATWRATDRLSLTAELSSDRYTLEDGRAFDYQSPYNFGLSYALSDRATISAAWLYGSEAALHFTYALNPADPPYPSGLETAPTPVQPRAANSQAAASWDLPENDLTRIRQLTADLLDGQGVDLHGLTISGTVARVEIENRDWQRSAQAVGRTARILTTTMPHAIDQFDIVLIQKRPAGQPKRDPAG